MNRTQIINNTLKEFRQNVPDYVGCGFVDMSTGMLLAVDTVDDHPREILDIVAAATADLFDGKSITQIEELWKESRGVTDGGHYFKEILVNSDNLVHLFMRSVTNQDIAAVVICTRKVSIGMLFAQARQVMREFEAARLSHNVCRIRSSRGPEPANRPQAQMRPESVPAPADHRRGCGFSRGYQDAVLIDGADAVAQVVDVERVAVGDDQAGDLACSSVPATPRSPWSASEMRLPYYSESDRLWNQHARAGLAWPARGPERPYGTSGRLRAARWNIGPVAAGGAR